MGHLFCHSRWAIDNEPYRDEACFNDVKRKVEIAKTIKVQLIPSLITTKYGAKSEFNNSHIFPPDKVLHITPSILTKERAEEFIVDVMQVCPGIAEIKEEWTFEYKLGTWKNYWKFLTVASLLRCIEESWLWIEEYFEMKDNGIPIDVALLVMHLGKRSPQPVCGHMILSDLSKLKHLIDFSLEEAMLKRFPETVNTSLWNTIQSSKWFLDHSVFPTTFPMSPQVYKCFLDLNMPIYKKQQIIQQKVYKVIE